MTVAGRRTWRGAAAAAVLAAAILAGGPRAGALEVLEITLSAMQGPGWRSGPARLRLDLSPAGDTTLEATVRGLELPPPLESVRAAHLGCAAARLEGPVIACPAARLTVELAGDEPAVLVADVIVDTAAGGLRLAARDLALAGGRASVALDTRGGALDLDVTAQALEAARVWPALALAGVPATVTMSDGRLTGEVRLRAGPGDGRLRAALRLQDAAFSDATGLQAGEGLIASLEVHADARGEVWDFRCDAALRAGAVYVHPLLVEAGAEPLTVHATGRWTPGVRLRVHEAVLRDPGVAQVQAAGEMSLAPAPALASLAVELASTPAAPLYRRWLKPFAGVGILGDLNVEGTVSARLDLDAAGPTRAALTLAGVGLGDGGGRFAVLGIDGEVHWSVAAGAPPSRLSWRELEAWSLGFGGGRVDAELGGRRARLLAPVSVRLLDGALRLERLEALGLGTPEQRVEADLALAPVSLARLSERLAWLPLSGSIAGDIPRLVYTSGRIAVQGDVRMRLFDGDLLVAGLTLEDPFGVVPRLRADLRLEGIDLAVLTRAMSFGSITGRLDGRVDGLVLEGWAPVAFDARLATPVDDPSPHRISQRAVDNLASLGGAGAVLSSTFLRFFEEFSYRRLGLSCRLRAGICEMGGVAPAERGYYIVEGGGLPPRVDVVGINRRVDWDTLVTRLKAVASARGPVVR